MNDKLNFIAGRLWKRERPRVQMVAAFIRQYDPRYHHCNLAFNFSNGYSRTMSPNLVDCTSPP